jgi:hypothetical protein
MILLRATNLKPENAVGKCRLSKCSNNLQITEIQKPIDLVKSGYIL